MRQVPHYTLIGNGRMATHISHYFDLLTVSYCHWHRKKHSTAQLDAFLTQSTHVLVLIKDNAINNFIQQYILSKYPGLMIIHFSGSLVSPYAYSAHPLQTFSAAEHYSLAEYQQIPFIIDSHAPPFPELLPGLQNPHYRINSENKAYYHAMCVLANNVTTLLWQKFYKEMTGRFGMDSHDLEPFLQRTFKNIQAHPAAALTGPIARKDWQTLQQDLNALQGDPFYSIFNEIINQCTSGDPDENRS